MREGWEVKKLGEIGKVSMCKRILKKQTSPTGDIPFYKIGTFGKIPNAFIPKEVYEEYRSKYSFPKKGDILLSASGTIGRRVVYDGKAAYFQDSNIVWIDNDEKKVSNEYLYKFYGFCDWNPSKGATIKRLYNDDLRRIQIPIPPLPEQQQIVALLDQAFAAIDQAKANIEKNIENAKELFQSKLNNIFSQKGEGWEEKTLGESVKSISTGPFGSLLHKSDYISDGIPVVNPINMIGNRIIPDSRKQVNSEIINRLSNYVLRPGYVVVARRGEIGRCALVEDQQNGWLCGTGSFFVKPSGQIRPKYLVHLLSSLRYRDALEKVSTGATMKNISNKALSNLVVGYPSVEEQDLIIQSIDKANILLDKLERTFERKLQLLNELKKSILQKAFAGELTSKGLSQEVSAS